MNFVAAVHWYRARPVTTTIHTFLAHVLSLRGPRRLFLAFSRYFNKKPSFTPSAQYSHLPDLCSGVRESARSPRDLTMLATAARKGQLRCQASNKTPAMLRHMLPRRIGAQLAQRFTTARAAALTEAAPEAEPRLSDTSSGAGMWQQQVQEQPVNGGAMAGTSPDPSPSPVGPASMDQERFTQHWSVEMWRDLKPRAWFDGLTDADRPLPERLQAFLNTLQAAVGEAAPLRSGEAASYWVYSCGRSAFFILQAAAGLVAAQAAQNGSYDSLTSAVLGLRSQGLQQTLSRGWVGPLTEALLCYYQDFENVKEGRYKLPWDMTTPGHRQFNPLFMLRRGAQFVREASATLARKREGQPEPVWLKSGLLPEYFQSTWHYQTDGWLSQRSAQVYESSTETLFVGRQDAMQRSTLVPLSDFMKGKDPSQVRALEVACGTGRFATFVKDNYPTLDLTLLDLSPFYLAEARSNMAYWKRMRAADSNLGGVDRTGTTFLQGAAENIPAPDASYDVVYCVYLLHELPPEIRRKAIFEMARVLKPGGMLVLTDSYQLGDRRAFDATAGNFQDFNEPYYRSYITTDLGGIAEEAGLICGMKVVSSTTKSLSFTKPEQQPNAAVEHVVAAVSEPHARPAVDSLLN